LGFGVAFNPESEPGAVAEAAGGLVDLVLCMSIHPGYSGQPFMPESIPRVQRLRELLPDDVFIQVDGGVGAGNVRQLRQAGASLLVAGTSVFGQKDIAAAYRDLAALRCSNGRSSSPSAGGGRRTRTRSSEPSSSVTATSSARAGMSG